MDGVRVVVALLAAHAGVAQTRPSSRRVLRYLICLCGEAMLMLMTPPRLMRPARRAKPAPPIMSIS